MFHGGAMILRNRSQNWDTSTLCRLNSETFEPASAEYALTKKFALYVNWDDVFAKDRLVYRRAPDTPAFAQTSQ